MSVAVFPATMQAIVMMVPIFATKFMIAPVTIFVAVVPAAEIVPVAEDEIAVDENGRSVDALEIAIAAMRRREVVVAIPRARPVIVVIAAAIDPDRETDRGLGWFCVADCCCAGHCEHGKRQP